MLGLEVRYIIQHTDTVSYGMVAAWTRTQAEGDPEHGFHVLSGYADPIMAARLIEEATADEGYVWIIPHEQDRTPGQVQLDGLLLIYGADIHSGRVRVLADRVGATPGSSPTEVPPISPTGHDSGPEPILMSTTDDDTQAMDSGLIQQAGIGGR